jgi:hypothetical protein
LRRLCERSRWVNDGHVSVGREKSDVDGSARCRREGNRGRASLSIESSSSACSCMSLTPPDCDGSSGARPSSSSSQSSPSGTSRTVRLFSPGRSGMRTPRGSYPSNSRLRIARVLVSFLDETEPDLATATHDQSPRKMLSGTRMSIPPKLVYAFSSTRSFMRGSEGDGGCMMREGSMVNAA